MADDFEPSPRHSKRRKTYASGRTILKSPQSPGALSSVSNALSSLSNRLLGRNKPQQPEQLHDDSAYASKEDSLNEDEIVVAEGVQEENTPTVQDENDMAIARSTRRSSRKTGEVMEAIEETTAAKKRTAPASKKSGQKTAPSSSFNASKETESGEPPNQRRSTRTKLDPVKRNNPQQKQESTATSTLSSASKKRKATAQDGKGMATGAEGLPEATPNEPHDQHENEGDDNAEPHQRSSGRERRKPRRFSPEPAPIEKAEPAQRNTQDINQASPSKTASSIASPQPKGILTPSRRRREGPRKSVVFDENEKTIEEQLGFKDIESSSSKGKRIEKERPEIPETPQSAPADDEEDLFLDRNPPQDILQSLELPYSKNFPTNGLPEDTPAVTDIKSLVLARLTSTSPPSSPASHLSTQYSTLHSLLTSTIASGESNSLLLLGSRGSGKSMLIDTALADLSSQHKDDFHVVRLNGFFQTDDRLALREIWRQLGREREGLGEVDENETTEVSGSYADTMASLLSLLSHPDEFDVDPNAMDLDPPENANKASKSVVIILDEFDLFTLHPRQTLLYNLFDIAQSKKAPIAVIGCSTRMDVVECLEKRVKSRFSHRWIHVPSIKTVEGMKEAVERMLCVEESVGVSPEARQERLRWNIYVKATFMPSAQIQALIQQTFYTTKSLPDLLAALYIPIATLSLPAPSSSNATTTPSSTTKSTKSKSKPKSSSTSKTPTTTSSATIAPSPSTTAQITIPTTSPPSILSLLPYLPTLHLSLLISATRLETIFSLTTINLNAVYTHYLDLLSRGKSHSTFASSAGGMRKWAKESCVGAWEELIRWEVVLPVVGGKEEVEGAGGGKEELSVRMVRVDVSLEEVAWGVKEKYAGAGDGEEVAGKGVGEVLGRWCREE